MNSFNFPYVRKNKSLFVWVISSRIFYNFSPKKALVNKPLNYSALLRLSMEYFMKSHGIVLVLLLQPFLGKPVSQQASWCSDSQALSAPPPQRMQSQGSRTWDVDGSAGVEPPLICWSLHCVQCGFLWGEESLRMGESYAFLRYEEIWNIVRNNAGLTTW